MLPDTAPRRVILGAAAVAVTAATIAIPGHPGLAVQLDGRPAMPSFTPLPAGSDGAAVLLSEHQASALAAREEMDAHQLHVHHLAHMRHLRYLRAIRLEQAESRSAPYAPRHARTPAFTQSRVVKAPPLPSGSPKAYAESLVGRGQFGCLDELWIRESGWYTFAENPGSGAYGIPQALPGYKMASAGADWRTNPFTQVRWGVGYIDDAYGSPCGAWAHEEADGWY